MLQYLHFRILKFTLTMKPDNTRPQTTVNPLSTGDFSIQTAASMAVAMGKYPTTFKIPSPTRRRMVGKQFANGWHMVGKLLVIGEGTKTIDMFCFIYVSPIHVEMLLNTIQFL